jgi:protein SCO1
MRKILLWIIIWFFGSAVYAQTPVGNLGGPFELIDQNGKTFASATLTGRPYAIFFGFTNCPEVCPTTLLELTNTLAKLGADADQLNVVFVTVDPEHDTPEHLRTYMSSFDPRIIALTGSLEQIAATAKLWNAFYNKVPDDDGSYTIVHSAYVYLMDRDHRFIGTMGFQDDEAEQLQKLKNLVKR